MSNHTQGPWVYDKDNCRIYSRDLKPDWVDDDPDWADYRVTVIETRGAMGGTDTVADAKLLALAPELYEYVASSASAGCATAQALIAKLK